MFIASIYVTKVLEKSKAENKFKNYLEIKLLAILLEILLIVKKKVFLMIA